MNPGEELKVFLTQIYSNSSSKADGFLAKLDNDLMCDGSLIDIVYRSCINYIIRRLITTAEYFRRIYDPKIYGQSRYQRELRRYLRDYTRLRDQHVNELLHLLVKCLKASDSYPSDTQSRKIRQEAEARSASCLICGRELDYTRNSQNILSVTIDHIWPRSFGGLSENHNLGVVCQHCNNELKKNYIDDSDYHYEEISLVATSYEEYTSKMKNRQYEVAVFARTQFKCFVCGQPAERVGELQIGRIEPSDSWHFLNLAGFCYEHKPSE